MSGPIAFLSVHSISEGQVDAARRLSEEMVEFVRTHHPRVAHFAIAIDDDRREMTVLQVHPDEESLLLHLELARDRIAEAYRTLDGTIRSDVVGSPSERLVAMMRQMTANPDAVRFRRPVGVVSRLERVGV